MSLHPLETVDWSRGEGLIQANLIRIFSSSLNKIQNQQCQLLLDIESFMTKSRKKVSPQPEGMKATHRSWHVSPRAGGRCLASGSSMAQLCASPSYTVPLTHFLGPHEPIRPPSVCFGSLGTKRVLTCSLIKYLINWELKLLYFNPVHKLKLTSLVSRLKKWKILNVMTLSLMT